MLDSNIKANIISSYDNIAQERNQYKNDTWEAKKRIKFVEFLNKANAKSLLDAGAGNGWDSKFFKETVFNVISIDISEEMISTCKEKGLEAYIMDFYKLEFEDSTFGAIWSLNSMLHVSKKDFPIVRAEFNRVLRPDGLLYMGIFGGFDREGILEEDKQIPKRFFNAYTDENTFNVEQFQNEMEARSYKVDVKDIEKEFLPTVRKQMMINNEVIFIYLFSSNNKMEEEAKHIYSDGNGYRNGSIGVEVSWAAPPHFYKRGEIIVQYVGDNEKLSQICMIY